MLTFLACAALKLDPPDTGPVHESGERDGDADTDADADTDTSGDTADTSCEPLEFYADADGDTFGDPAVVVSECVAPGGFVGDATDCDDTRAAVYPGAVDACGDDGSGGSNAEAVYVELAP